MTNTWRVPIALAMATVLMAETTVAVAAPARAAAPPAPTAAVENPRRGPAEAQDEASARLMARIQERRIEILDARTGDTSSWANPDGTVTVESFTGPIRVRDDKGAWHPLDMTLTVVDGVVRPRAAAAEITFSAGGSRAALAQVTRGGRTLGVDWPGRLPEPVLAANVATYPNAVPGGDLVVTALPEGFSHSVVLRERPTGPVEFRLPVASENLVLEEAAGKRLRWRDHRGNEVATAPPPLMWGSSANPGSADPEHTAVIDTTVEKAKDGKGQVLVLRPSQRFLADPDLVYPVTVDPTNTLTGPTTDTWIQHSAYPNSQRGSTELKAGTYDGVQKARSFLKFNTANYTGKKIVSTELRLYSYYSSTCATTGSGVEVRRITANWDPAAISWSAQPATTATGAVTSKAAKGYSSACPAGHVSWNVNSIVQAWADGQPNYGIRLAAVTETDVLTWRRYRSANYVPDAHDPSVEPSLTVTYSSYPAVPASLAVSPSQVNAYNGVRYVTSLTPKLSAKVSDADGGTVRAQFEVTPNPTYNDTTYTYTATSGAVASGSAASLAIPAANPLPAGKRLRYRVRGYDGANYGPWSSYVYFTMNTAKPGAPTIDCDAYPKETWADRQAAGAECTFSTTASDGQGYLWGLNDPTTPKRIDDTVRGTGGEPLTVTINPADGWHTLYARTVDSGGNISDGTTAYSFGVGADGAALLSPGEGDRPARRTKLAARGKPTYTQVTYQYRRGETDTWTNVPLGGVTRDSNGLPLTAWPVALTGGVAPDLTWNVTDSFADDGPVEVRAAFTDGARTGYSVPHTITVDRDAGTAPDEEIGPGSVNLLTGDYGISESDVSLFELSVTRSASSRRPDAGSQQEGQAPIFGREWTSGTTAEITDSDWVYLKKTSATSLVLVDVDGEELGFAATSNGGWRPEPGAEEFTLTGAFTGSFTLKDTDGTVTVFTRPDSTATTWQVASSSLDGLANSTTTVVSEVVTVDGKKLVRPRRIIAPTSAVSASTCTATPSTRGCRALEFTYATTTTATGGAFGDHAGQVKEIRAWATAPGASAATARTVQVYAYDTSGRLRETWDPQISPALKTAYSYDSAGRVTQLTPPGELPWTFTYGNAGQAATSGDGMLLKASRPGLKRGTADVVEGVAATSVVYDVPLTGATAPYGMGRADVAAWGQTDVPTDATAVFPVDVTPPGHAGSALAATDYRRATVTYADASGREVNAAAPGGHISATQYDHFGNTIRQLTAGNRAVALGLSAQDRDVLMDLGILDLSTVERAELLSTVSVFNTTGTQELESLGPLRRVTLTADVTSGGGVLLAADESVVARSWTVNRYDEDRPTDGTAKVEDQVTTVTEGAQLLDFPHLHLETRVTRTGYDWVKGLATRTIVDPTGLALTTTTEYDGQGRTTKQILPGGTGADAATRVTTYWSATGTGPCAGRPEWADLVCTVAPGGAVTGGGANPTQLPTTTTEYDWWGNDAKVTETANGATRTTTTTYDNAGRSLTVTVAGGLGPAVPATTTEYDPATGTAVRTVSATAGTITKVFDRLGREISYTDADGGVTTTEYDLLGRTVKVTDNAPSTVTFSYDHSAEPRGLVTGSVDSLAGAFSASYDADGSVATEKLPGGHTLTVTEDTDGNTTSRVYTRDSDGEVILADTVAESVHGQVVHHVGWSAQSYRYDRAGRLITVHDSVDDVCTRRSYVFDRRTNRTSSTTATDGSGGCPTGGGDTVSHSYDSADRLVDSGYRYDAFGRTTELPGSVLSYYVNDLAHRQVAGGRRQTWQLDAAHRFRSWTVESGDGDTWTRTSSKVNHYDGDGDSPRWIVEDVATGALTRNVESASGEFAATTGRTGDTVLQLSNIHGDVALQLPLDATRPPVVLDNDEYGNPRAGQPATRYNWLGAKQRSAETLTGLTLMGVRLYHPVTGRFLTVDPVYGGNNNAYEYANGDPVNRFDTNGQWSWAKKKLKAAGKKISKTAKAVKRKVTSHIKKHRKFYGWAAVVGAGIIGGACVAATAGICAGAGGLLIGGAIGALGGAAQYRIANRRRTRGGYIGHMARGAAGVVAGGVYLRIRTVGAPQTAKRWADGFRRESKFGKHRRKVNQHWRFGTRWIR
ncbi:DNRLRE domain-containing protein [Micromonospora sp. CA-263727]|uniref:DNRLRE domain-containing protein n=1 Tax=Micromonospora sp. CA-263727 TaxID=3239967 RepID=UPI003D918B98